MNTENAAVTDELEIRRLIDDRAKAVHAKNVEGVLCHYAPDIVRFDLAPPLQTAGADALDRRNLAGWFSTWDGPPGYEVRDFSVETLGDIGFCRGLVRISGTKIDAGYQAVWARQTLCLRRAGDRWKIVHEHTSVPFYMDGSLRAAVDLEP